MKVLLVEDEEDLLHVTATALRESGFSVDLARDGMEGLVKAETADYDAIVLDLMLPRMDGWEVLSRLRQSKTTPVLILTARDALADRVEGLNRGADDYLTKPFELEELIARLRALIRRSAGSPSPIVEVAGVQIDTAARTVMKRGEVVELSAKEYALLELLALHRGRLVTRSMIYEHIYGEEDDTLSNVVDVYVSNLRRKLGSELIETRRGQGYIIRP
ncbi:MAG TPA: response regulator transcription factor [Pirellulales bacterium]|jgi:two-component system OmpR family response regulator|nr:response regulator transcription factor [Pirellulales bacterium]